MQLYVFHTSLLGLWHICSGLSEETHNRSFRGSRGIHFICKQDRVGNFCQGTFFALMNLSLYAVIGF